MADGTQPWAERTLEVPTDPWAHADEAWPGPATPPYPGGPARGGPVAGAAPRAAFQRGVAQVSPSASRGHPPARGADHTRVVDAVPPAPPAPRPPLAYRMRQLRRGREWSAIGALFAFVGWGVWLISVRGGDLTVPVLAFVLVLLVAVGVFALARLLGQVVLERGLGRVRHSATGAHLVTGAFLVAAGLGYLRQTPWIVESWNWVTALF
ncbi:MAG TPA: hypothetical protein VNV66_12565 [Pilimelia sp.]|nr:hypothetical protein [Pilimelia sp.]